MPRFVVCECCGRRLPATSADVGRAVICPTSRRLVTVGPENLQGDDTPAPVPGARARFARRVAAVVVLFLLLGLAGWLLIDRMKAGTPEVARTDPPAPIEPPAPTIDPPKPPTETAPAPRPVVPPTTPTPDATAPPRSPVIPPPAPAPSPPPVVARLDSHGLKIHQLAKRIDLRTPEELLKELLAFREVSLDIPAAPRTTLGLIELAFARKSTGGVYPGPMVAAKNRPDLAGLPFRFGAGTMLFKDRAESLDALSKRLRVVVQECIPAGRTDPRPDPDKLHAALLAGDAGLIRDRKWATAEAVPCIQQMLQADGRDVRRMSVELLRGLDTSGATEALVRWCVFDVDADNRAAAVDALRTRDLPTVSTALVAHLRYPWPRAAEHAAEALVALECRTVVPELAALLALPDPDAPATVDGSKERFRREVVRVNHARNCMMCHPPSFADTDLVRAAIPDPARPLTPPTTPGYYTSGSQFVTAATTYLRQDFSAMQPVPAPGLWPEQQRYDYLVAVRPLRTGEADLPPPASPWRAAILFALRELSGRDLGTTAADWLIVRGNKTVSADLLTLEVNRYLALFTNPEALVLVYLQDFGPSLLTLTPAEQAVVLSRFRRVYGVASTRYAFIAYLEWLARSGEPAVRDQAAKLLLSFAGTASDDPAAFDPVVAAKLLNHANPQVRASAASAIGSLGTTAKPQYKVLLDSLKDADAAVRAATIEALANIPAGPDEMFDAIAAATADASPRVRAAAVDALVKLKLLPKSSARALAEGLVRKGDWDSPEQRAAFEKAVAALLTDLGSRGSAGYSIVLRAATGETATEASPATLAKVLQAFGPPDKSQLAKLVPLLAHKDYRAVAESHLMAAGDDAVPALIDGLRSESAKVREASAEVLGRAASLGRNPPAGRAAWSAALDALAPLKSSDPSAAVKEAAAAALAKLTAKP